MDKQAMDILQQLLKGQQETNSRLENLEKHTGTIISEVARLREDITEVKKSISGEVLFYIQHNINYVSFVKNKWYNRVIG